MPSDTALRCLDGVSFTPTTLAAGSDNLRYLHRAHRLGGPIRQTGSACGGRMTLRSYAVTRQVLHSDRLATMS